MRRFGIGCLLVLITFSAFAQKKKKAQIADAQHVEPVQISPDSLHLSVFRLAMKYNDYPVAVNALYNMWALHPENTSLKDSLVLLYSGMGNSVQSILLAREILKENPNNIPVLTAKALSEQRLGLYKESLESYELLYDKNPNLYDLYQIASIQYAMKRYAEAQNTLKVIAGNKLAAQSKVSISGADNTSQNVNFIAAAYNLMGVIALEIKEYTLAQENFKKAVEAEPDFELAQRNLQILTTELNKKKDTKTPVKK